MLAQRYFPKDTDEEIKTLISDLADIYEVMNKLAGGGSEVSFMNAAQKGFTVSRDSIAFRVLLDYKGVNGHIAVNFPNWRDWERVLPLKAKNHFLVGGYKRKPKEYGRFEHGYYHSYLFKTKEEFINFFNKYMITFPLR